jgi:hypothetical protein
MVYTQIEVALLWMYYRLESNASLMYEKSELLVLRYNSDGTVLSVSKILNV